MISKNTGQLLQDFHVVGHISSPVFLLDGKDPIIFEAGFTCLANYVESDLKRILKSRAPAYLFLTHLHYDHAGAVASLKENWPEMKIVASSEASSILARERAVKHIKELNQKVANSLKDWKSNIPGNLFNNNPFEPFQIDIEIKNDLNFDITHNEVRIFRTPGHTRDSLSFFIPEKRILIASEAIGTQDYSGYIFSDFLVNYEDYISSLERLERLDVDILCQGHNMVFTGENARERLKRSLPEAVKCAALLEKMLIEENKNIDRVVSRMKRHEYTSRPQPKQMEAVYEVNLRAKIKTILSVMG